MNKSINVVTINSKGREYATRAQLCILEKRSEEVVGFSDRQALAQFCSI